MRRQLFSVALAALCASPLAAQTGSGSEGALFLLLPTGAQAVGMGQAIVASKPGSEGIWWNPASIAGQDKGEIAIHHSKTIAGVGDALTFVLHPHSFGTAAFSVNHLNIGEQQVTDEFNNPIGTILPRDVVFAGTVARMFGKRVSAGINYKLIQIRIDCQGECGSVGAEVQSSSAADLTSPHTACLLAT